MKLNFFNFVPAPHSFPDESRTTRERQCKAQWIRRQMDPPRTIQPQTEIFAVPILQLLNS
jgi:hypothetical protein